MLSYILRRLLLVVPTLWAIITINFFIIQMGPSRACHCSVGR